MFRQIVELHNTLYFWDGLMADQMVQDSINAEHTQEALEWLNESTYCPAQQNSDSMNALELEGFIAEIYKAGAANVLATEIRYYRGIRIGDRIIRSDDATFDIFTAELGDEIIVEQIVLEDVLFLAIELPVDSNSRKRVFAWDAEYQTALKWPPTRDYGQKYLLIDLQ